MCLEFRLDDMLRIRCEITFRGGFRDTSFGIRMRVLSLCTIYRDFPQLSNSELLWKITLIGYYIGCSQD